MICSESALAQCCPAFGPKISCCCLNGSKGWGYSSARWLAYSYWYLALSDCRNRKFSLSYNIIWKLPCIWFKMLMEMVVLQTLLWLLLEESLFLLHHYLLLSWSRVCSFVRSLSTTIEWLVLLISVSTVLNWRQELLQWTAMKNGVLVFVSV